MKKFIVLIGALISFSSFGAVIATCDNAKVPTDEFDPKWVPLDFKITVNEEYNSARVITAEIFLHGEIFDAEPNIDIVQMDFRSEMKFVKAVMTSAKLPANLIHKGTKFDLHPMGNSDDATGVILYVMYDRNGSVIGKVFKLGWGYGICN